MVSIPDNALDRSLLPGVLTKHTRIGEVIARFVAQAQPFIYYAIVALDDGQYDTLTLQDILAIGDEYGARRDTMALMDVRVRRAGVLRPLLLAAPPLIQSRLGLGLARRRASDSPRQRMVCIGDDGQARGVLNLGHLLSPAQHVPLTAGVPSRFLQVRANSCVRPGVEMLVETRIALLSGYKSVMLDAFDVPPGGAEVMLSVYGSDFEVLGALLQTVHVPPDRDAPWVPFKLRPLGEGRCLVKVIAYRQQAYLGELDIEIDVGPPTSADRLLESMVPIGMESPEPGDALLEVRYNHRSGEARITLMVPPDRESGVVSFGRGLEHDTESLVASFNAQARGTGYDPTTAQSYLRGLGKRLYQVLPEPVHALLWRRHEDIKRLVIVAEGDTLPWEACYLHRETDGINVGFFAERFMVVRGMPVGRPARQLNRRSAAIVIPSGSPADAEAEATAVDEAIGPFSRVTRLRELLALFEQAEVGLLHFACHNTFRFDTPELSSITMEDGPFIPALVADHAGRLTAAAPLVVMNACRSDGQAVSYTGLGGWATDFMRAGAGAFIGSFWEIRSSSAKVFAANFYNHLKAGMTLGEAVGQARRAIQDEHPNDDPTWLAYSFYGDSNARLT